MDPQAGPSTSEILKVDIPDDNPEEQELEPIVTPMLSLSMPYHR